MRRVLFFTTLLVFALTSSAWAADVSGTWSLTMQSPQGQDETFDIDIKAAGEKLTITSSNHPVLQTLEGTGTLKGDAIEMNLKSTGESMAGVGLNFKGTVTGNKMAGTREIDTSGMSSGGGDRGGAPGGEGAAPGGQAPAAGGEGGAPGGAPGGQAPAGGGQAPGGQAPGGQAPGGEAGSGAPGGAAGSGAPGGAAGGGSDAWTAVKK